MTQFSTCQHFEIIVNLDRTKREVIFSNRKMEMVSFLSVLLVSIKCPWICHKIRRRREVSCPKQMLRAAAKTSGRPIRPSSASELTDTSSGIRVSFLRFQCNEVSLASVGRSVGLRRKLSEFMLDGRPLRGRMADADGGSVGERQLTPHPPKIDSPS